MGSRQCPPTHPTAYSPHHPPSSPTTRLDRFAALKDLEYAAEEFAEIEIEVRWLGSMDPQ